MTIKFTVPGAPFGKQRPRYGKGHTYTPQETREHEDLIAWEYRRQCGMRRFPEGSEMIMIITAYFPIPKRANQELRGQMLDGKVNPTGKPDWDNIGKLVADALNDVAYDDDKNIIDAHVMKRYSDDPRTEICIFDTE